MVLIIAEAGVNHNGDIVIAKKLVDAAKECGADIIKFQLFNADDLVIPNTSKALYQKREGKENETQFQMLKKLELNFDEQKELKNYCDEINIEFLSSAFDLESLVFIKKMKLKRYKIPSGEITNLPYLRFIGAQKKPLLLSTGMSNITEIHAAILELLKAGANKKDITILHCTSEYPAPIEDINLRALKTIRDYFDVEVGYSDHTLGIEVSIAAVALGAKVIEKHITLDKNLDGPDHKASLEPDQFYNLVKSIRNVSLALGEPKKDITNSEIKNLKIVRKSIVAKKDIKKGELFSKDNLCTKRPGTGISPMRWEEIIGTMSKRNYKKNQFIISN